MLSPQNRDHLRPQDARFPCDQKSLANGDFSAIQTGKIDPHCGKLCDTWACSEKSLSEVCVCACEEGGRWAAGRVSEARGGGGYFFVWCRHSHQAESGTSVVNLTSQQQHFRAHEMRKKITMTTTKIPSSKICCTHTHSHGPLKILSHESRTLLRTTGVGAESSAAKSWQNEQAPPLWKLGSPKSASGFFSHMFGFIFGMWWIDAVVAKIITPEQLYILNYHWGQKDYLPNFYSRGIILGNSMCLMCTQEKI